MVDIKVKPFLRWAGSKKQILSKLTRYWSKDYNRYIEPFMGSASLFFAIKPAKAVLSDINQELVNTFVVVRDYPDKLYKFLSLIPIGSKSYYKIRDINLTELDFIERAARFIFLNRFCFNGLYRTNLKGDFNVPYSSSKTGNLPNLEILSNASKALRGIDIYCGDFQELIFDEVGEGDFVFLDPPYFIRNTKIFTQYGPQNFGTDDIQRLRTCTEKIDKRGAYFVLTYAFSQEIIDSFGDWFKEEIYTRRCISGFAKHRKLAKELVFSNC